MAEPRRYVPRTLESVFSAASAHFPVLLVTGARQVGKTTMLRHLAGPERTFVSLDDPLVLELARNDPALFLQRFRPPLLLDEFQYAPSLLPHLKREADRANEAGLFWLTGSQVFQGMRGVTESLAGRVAIFHLQGLSRREALGFGHSAPPFLPSPTLPEERILLPSGVSDLYATILRGSLPALALDSQLDPDLFHSSYVQTYLQRDLRDLAKVGDESAFLRFLRATAARTGQLLNVAALARDADVAPNTAKHWLSILQTSGIVFLLEPYSSNRISRLVKAPKLYFCDTGLCAYLTGWTTAATLESGAMSGAFFETWALGEIRKSLLHAGKTATMFYYRDRDQVEIDLLLEQDGTLFPVEFKKTASPKRDAFRSFAALRKTGVPVGTGGVVCFAEHFLPLAENVYAIPAGLL
jgi:hypothetical protein